MSNKDTVIFDLDGTLALCEHRRHMIHGDGKKDWDGFFLACDKDEPNIPVIALWNALQAYRRVILSGRSDIALEKTLAWFKAHGLEPDLFLQRKQGDYTPDDQLKVRWLDEVGRDRILFIVDDRQKVVDAWRREGLTCFQVAPGNF